MQWQFWQRKSIGNLPEGIWRILAKEYDLDIKTLSKLSCVETAGRFVNRPVRYIRVFDPTLVTRGVAIRRYDDIKLYKKALLFEGHIERDGSVYLIDKRQKKAANRIAAENA